MNESNAALAAATDKLVPFQRIFSPQAAAMSVATRSSTLTLAGSQSRLSPAVTGQRIWFAPSALLKSGATC